jgi:hypothetical protein
MLRIKLTSVGSYSAQKTGTRAPDPAIVPCAIGISFEKTRPIFVRKRTVPTRVPRTSVPAGHTCRQGMAAGIVASCIVAPTTGGKTAGAASSTGISGTNRCYVLPTGASLSIPRSSRFLPPALPLRVLICPEVYGPRSDGQFVGTIDERQD